MLKTSFGAAISALLIAGALGLAATAPASALTQSECHDQWVAGKAAGKDVGKLKDYKAANCPTDAAAAPTPAPVAAAPAQTPTPAPAKPTPAAAAPAAPTPVAAKPIAPAPTAAVTPTAANEYATEAEAKGKCGAGPVVWMNTKSKVFHDNTSSRYGKTKHGAYMCQAEANAMGGHAAKNEK